VMLRGRPTLTESNRAITPSSATIAQFDRVNAGRAGDRTDHRRLPMRELSRGRVDKFTVQADTVIPPLIPLTESLDVGFVVRIEEFFATLLPRRSQLRRCDVPVWPALLADGTEILAEIFHYWPAEEPVAVVDLVNDQTGLEDNDVRDHRIVVRVRVFGDVEILLDDTLYVGEERPVGANPAAILIRPRDMVGADRDKSTIANLEFSMKSDKAFRHPAIPRAITSAAEDQNHWILPLQFREFPALRGVVGKLIVGQDSPRNDVGPHANYSPAALVPPSRISVLSSGDLRRSCRRNCSS
jgi:hypothetical protein